MHIIGGIPYEQTVAIQNDDGVVPLKTSVNFISDVIPAMHISGGLP
jgi:hypothetical protein